MTTYDELKKKLSDSAQALQQADGEFSGGTDQIVSQIESEPDGLDVDNVNDEEVAEMENAINNEFDEAAIDLADTVSDEEEIG